MKRYKPLKRSGNLKRTPLKRVSPRKLKDIEEKKKLREVDNEFYEGVWYKRPHRCRICDKGLGEEALTVYFHHILEKRNYEEYRHCEWNIVILCWECHQNADNNRIELLNRYKRVLLYKIEKGAC